MDCGIRYLTHSSAYEYLENILIVSNLDCVVLSTLPSPPPSNPTSPIPFFHLLELLKTTKREGWRRLSIDNCESISDHMYRMSIMTMLAPRSLLSRLDVAHCTKMALVHDMAESLVGDITPVDGIPVKEKHRRESITMDYIADKVLGSLSGGLEQGKKIKEIWQEYEDNSTMEAKFVHDVDKIELLLQMVEYERSHKGEKDLSEFLGVRHSIQLHEVKVWCNEILDEREAFWQSLNKTAQGLKVRLEL